MTKIQRLMKLHRLLAPIGAEGTDTSGTGAGAADPVDPAAGDPDHEGGHEDGDAAVDLDEDDPAAGADADVVVTIGDDPHPTEDDDVNRAPEWVRELRRANREKDRAIRERDAEIARLKGAGGAATQAVTLGPKPSLEACGYDSDKYEKELDAWHARKREVDEQTTKKQRLEDEQRAAWQARIDAYSKAKTGLKVKDFDDAEASAQELLNITQQGIIINGAENPALLIYALGKNTKKAKELAGIQDPVKFAFAVAKLETQLKVTPRKSAPVPERTIRGSAPGAAIDSTLERLDAEAEKTGDMSKVVKYRQDQRKKQR